jgi:hypothetical protein
MGRFNARPRPTWSTALLRRDRALNEVAISATAAIDETAYQPGLMLAGVFFAIADNDGHALRDYAARLAALAETMRGGVLRLMCLADQLVATLEGRLIEAEAISIEQFALSRGAGLAEAITYRAVQQMTVRREQDRLAEIIRAWSAELDARPQSAVLMSTLAFARAESGDFDTAAARLHDAWQADFRTMPDEAAWPMAMAGWSEVAAMVGDRDAAATLHELLAIADGMHIMTGGIACGPAARLLARLELVLDRPDDADVHFATAIEQAQSLRTPVWVARGCFDWADSLAERGIGDRALELLTQGEAAIASLQLPRLQRQSTELRARLDA